MIPSKRSFIRIIMSDYKICRLCKMLVPLDGYYKRSSSKDGLESACKACRSGPKKIPTTVQPMNLDDAVFTYGLTMRAYESASANCPSSSRSIRAALIGMIEDDPEYRAGLIKSSTGRYKRPKAWRTMADTLAELRAVM